jgi:hypothetical protein
MTRGRKRTKAVKAVKDSSRAAAKQTGKKKMQKAAVRFHTSEIRAALDRQLQTVYSTGRSLGPISEIGTGDLPRL